MSRKAMDGFSPSYPGNALVGAVICSPKLLMHLGIDHPCFSDLPESSDSQRMAHHANKLKCQPHQKKY